MNKAWNFLMARMVRSALSILFDVSNKIVSLKEITLKSGEKAIEVSYFDDPKIDIKYKLLVIKNNDKKVKNKIDNVKLLLDVKLGNISFGCNIKSVISSKVAYQGIVDKVTGFLTNVEVNPKSVKTKKTLSKRFLNNLIFNDFVDTLISYHQDILVSKSDEIYGVIDDNKYFQFIKNANQNLRVLFKINNKSVIDIIVDDKLQEILMLTPLKDFFVRELN